MIGGLMKTTSRFAVAAAAGLFMSGFAHAGGAIGGDCCADLEERVAELEATTARKGNRKVSLTVYGQVKKAIVAYDNDLAEAFFGDGPVIIDNNISSSRFGLTGSARISSDVYAGYRVEFDIGDGDFTDTISLRHNDLWIGSKTFGKLSLGHGSTASDGIAEIDLSGTSVAGGSLNIVGWATTEGNLAYFDNLDGDSRKERIRYDSPTLAGFKLSTSWQDNEDWDVALRYGATYGDFTIAAGIAYLNQSSTDFPLLGETFFNIPGLESEQLSGSASVAHNPTGLSLTFAAGEKTTDIFGTEVALTEYWYLKAGIKRRLFAAGQTALSVDYHSQTQYNDILDIDVEKWGIQLVQNIDAAAMELYVSAWSADVEVLGNNLNNVVDEDAVMAGARIKF